MNNDNVGKLRKVYKWKYIIQVMWKIPFLVEDKYTYKKLSSIL